MLLSLVIDTHHAYAARARMRLLVTPFENGAAAQSLSAFSIGIAAALAERFEDDASLDVLNDDTFVLTKEQATLVSAFGRDYNLAAANTLALSRGATHFLTGRFSGQVWKWTLETDLYAASGNGPMRVGHGVVTGDLNEPSRLVLSTNSLHSMLAATTRDAFAEAGHPLSADMIKVLQTPSTKDSYAFLKLSRAYVRYFKDVQDESGDTAIGIAEYAVRVDPTYAEAQRFYATLLLAADQPKKARIHFEFAVQARPKDVRSLVELGRLEINEKNPDIAKGYLERAILARPKDAVPQYWLGRAKSDLKDATGAMKAFEAARTLDSVHLDARRSLVQMYSDVRRYSDAATELVAITSITPQDPFPRLLLAATLRAAHERSHAIDTYFAGVAAFPKDARFHKFLGDQLAADGRLAEATREYAAAATLDPHDQRAVALARGDTTALLGGPTLEDAIVRATSTIKEMEVHRVNFQLATSDALLDLTINKEKGCRDGRAASSAVLARSEGREHDALGSTLSTLANGLQLALGAGEWSALTLDEHDRATQALLAMATAERDVREMRSVFDRQLLPLYRSFQCETYDGPITTATTEDVQRHMLDRQVVWPKVAPPSFQMPFTPQITPDFARLVMFSVDNRAGATDRVLSLDGAEIGSITAGTSVTFTTTIGLHKLCLVPKGTTCDATKDARSIYLHDGWTIRVRPAT